MDRHPGDVSRHTIFVPLITPYYSTTRIPPHELIWTLDMAEFASLRADRNEIMAMLEFAFGRRLFSALSVSLEIEYFSAVGGYGGVSNMTCV
jgi:hypothetical protein